MKELLLNKKSKILEFTESKILSKDISSVKIEDNLNIMPIEDFE